MQLASAMQVEGEPAAESEATVSNPLDAGAEHGFDPWAEVEEPTDPWAEVEEVAKPKQRAVPPRRRPLPARSGDADDFGASFGASSIDAEPTYAEPTSAPRALQTVQPANAEIHRTNRPLRTIGLDVLASNRMQRRRLPPLLPAASQFESESPRAAPPPLVRFSKPDSMWAEIFSDEHSRSYWHNIHTGETTWEDPAAAGSPPPVTPANHLPRRRAEFRST